MNHLVAHAWPDGRHLDHTTRAGGVSGYNFLHRSQGGMAFWAVPDLAVRAPADFVRLVRR